eukprot:gene24028-27187_t
MSLDDNFSSSNRSGDEHEHDLDVEFEVGAESESTEDGESYEEKKRKLLARILSRQMLTDGGRKRKKKSKKSRKYLKAKLARSLSRELSATNENQSEEQHRLADLMDSDSDLVVYGWAYVTVRFDDIAGK